VRWTTNQRGNPARGTGCGGQSQSVGDDPTGGTLWARGWLVRHTGSQDARVTLVAIADAWLRLTW